MALIAVNMAVDGVALKRAVDAWAGALPEDQASRLAAAEAVRWLEWGVNSFFTILLGVTLLIFATALLSQAHLGTRTRLAAVTGTLAGALLIVNGLTVGAHGFEPTALPLVATGLYVVMALGIPTVDRAARSSASARPAATASAPDAPWPPKPGRSRDPDPVPAEAQHLGGASRGGESTSERAPAFP